MQATKLLFVMALGLTVLIASAVADGDYHNQDNKGPCKGGFWPDGKGCCPELINGKPYYRDYLNYCYPKEVGCGVFYADAKSCYPDNKGIYLANGEKCPYERQCKQRCIRPDGDDDCHMKTTTEECKTTTPRRTTEEHKTTTEERRTTTEERKTTPRHTTTEECKTTTPRRTTEEHKTTTEECKTTTPRRTTTEECKTTTEECKTTTEECKTTTPRRTTTEECKTTTEECKTTTPRRTTTEEHKTTTEECKTTTEERKTTPRHTTTEECRTTSEKPCDDNRKCSNGQWKDGNHCCPRYIDHAFYYRDFQGCYPIKRDCGVLYADANGCYPDQHGQYLAHGDCCPKERQCKPECDGGYDH